MSKSVLSKFRLEFISRILASIAAGLTTVYLARVLSPDQYGVLFLTLSILTIIGFIGELGIAKSGARYISKYQEQDKSQLQYIIIYSLAFLLVTCIPISILLVIYRHDVADILGEPELALLLLFGPLYIILSALKRYGRILLQGFNDIKSSALVNGVEGVSRLVLVMLLTMAGFGALGAFLGFSLAFGLGAIVGLLLVRGYYNNYKDPTPPETGLAKRIFRYNIPITVTRSASKLDREIDTILVGYFLNPVSVSYYVISKQIITFANMPASSLGFTVSPVFGSQKANQELEKSSRLFEDAFTNIFLLYLPGTVGLFLLAEPTIEFVLGRDYLGGETVLQILSLYMLLQAINSITSEPLDYIGRASARAKVRMITGVMNVILNILLIPIYGVEAAAAVSVITYSFYIVCVLYILHTEFPLRIYRLLKSILKVIVICVIMGLVVLQLEKYIESIFSLVFVIISGLLVWAFFSILFNMLDTDDLVAVVHS